MIQSFTQAVNLSFHQGVKEKLARMGTIALGVLVKDSMGYMAQRERDTCNLLSSDFREDMIL